MAAEMISAPLKTIDRLVLASASPRRRFLLDDLGLDFEIIVAEVEEQPFPGETPEDFVLRAACDKTGAVAETRAGSWVLGADTVVVLEGKILGKPEDATDALKMLQELSGRDHLVHTGFCLQHEERKITVSKVVTTEVFFTSFTREIAEAYVATGEPLDKAGAYGIQGRGGFLVERIKGSYSNVVGLPLVEVIEELLRYRVIACRTAA